MRMVRIYFHISILVSQWDRDFTLTLPVKPEEGELEFSKKQTRYITGQTSLWRHVNYNSEFSASGFVVSCSVFDSCCVFIKKNVLLLVLFASLCIHMTSNPLRVCVRAGSFTVTPVLRTTRTVCSQRSSRVSGVAGGFTNQKSKTNNRQSGSRSISTWRSIRLWSCT